LQQLSQILPFVRVSFATPIANPTLQKGTFCNAHRKSYPQKGTFCDACHKSYPSEGYLLQQPSQILPFRRVPFATPIANPTLQKGTFCNAHCKSYPSEGYLLQRLSQILPFRRVPFATPIANPTLQKNLIQIKNLPVLILQ
jgi:hypothetical protein